MKNQFCSNCGETCWHNPRKKVKPTDEQQYRCTNCGYPPRSGNLNIKNIVRKIGKGIFGHIEWGGPAMGPGAITR